MQGPGSARQRERLAPAFDRLTQAFEQGRLEVARQPAALEPEQILVLEIAGEIADFDRAVRRIEGFEWLAEQTEDETAAADEEFALVGVDGERRAYGRQLFVLASDATAWQQLLRLWAMYQRGERLPYGLTKFRDLFDHLRDLRPWDDRDRLLRAGAAQAWERDLAADGDTLVPFEAELWLRGSAERRQAEREAIAAELQAVGGDLLQEVVLEDISYHGLLGSVPARLLKDAAARGSVRWMSTGGVRLFHAAGQAAAPPPEEIVVEDGPEVRLPVPARPQPRVAIFDGVPVENHEMLADRLLVDDPEGWAATTPAARRLHGTQMASLAVHGDLSAPQVPPDELLYVRPILRYEAPDWVVGAREEIPADRLVVDVVHSAVARLFEGENPVAPTVRVIGLSVGDASQQFDRFLSPWARLLDWLSFRYRVLFLVSAGNHLEAVRVPEGADLADAGEAEREILDSVRRNALSRRLLAPAESINALTIGSAHADGSNADADAGRLDPFQTDGLSSVITPTASGFRRAIKPEALLAGGRQLLRARPAAEDGERVLDVATTMRAPGLLAAAPPRDGGSLRERGFLCGTSGANALAVRGAFTLLAQLDALRGLWGETFPPAEFDDVLVKALLVHTARWGNAREAVAAVLTNAGETSIRAAVARFLGYGQATPEHTLVIGSQNEVTALYAAEIEAGDAHHYRLPLPPSLASSTVERRLTLTLASLTPINAAHRNYRRAAVWVEPAGRASVFGSREEAEARAARRGTLQHETLRGEAAVPYVDGEAAGFVVACRADAGALETAVPYALVVTLQVPLAADLPIYQEVRERLAVRLGVRPRP